MPEPDRHAARVRPRRPERRTFISRASEVRPGRAPVFGPDLVDLVVGEMLDADAGLVRTAYPNERAAIFRRSQYGWAYHSPISTIMTARAAASPRMDVPVILPTAT